MTSLDDELYGLGVHPSRPEPLLLLPLVEVAWADGEVQPEERSLILSLQEEHHTISEDGRMLLESWLTFEPSRGYFDAGRQALVSLIEQGRIPWEVSDEGPATLNQALQVAQSAGGWFGFRPVERSEQEALAQIASALRLATPGKAGSTDEVAEPGGVARNGSAPNNGESSEVTDPGRRGRPSPTRFPQGVPEAKEPSLASPDEPLALPIGARLSIGRRRTNTVVIASDPAVSREHAVLEADGDRVVIQDLESVTGTYVNGERVLRRQLFGGETVQVGGTMFIVTGIST